MKRQPISRRQHKTRLAFMNALLELIAERGLDAVSVSAIAERAGYGRWTFYQYFDSKEDAAWQAFIRWMTLVDEQVITAVQHLETPRREYESWRLLLRAFHAHRSFLTRLDSVRISDWREKAKEFLVAQFLDHLRAGRFALVQGVRHDIAARLYVGAIMELLDCWGRDPAMGDADELAGELFRFIFNQAPPE